MAFDFENAVLQGWARDYTLNDWAIEARNVDVVLEDAGGVSEFRLLDSDNVAVVVADSDGYLAIAGNAEINGGHLDIKGEGLVNTEFITLRDQIDEASIFLVDANPDGVVGGTRGSIALNYNDGYVYSNTDDATGWIRFALANEISGATTLQIAYKNDPDGSDAIINTDVADGNVIIAGTEAFQVTADGGIDLDTGFDMDGAGPFDVDITGTISLDGVGDSNFTTTDGNIVINVINTGDIINRLTSPGSDFVVDQGAGSEFIRAETSVNELRLGDTSPDPIDVNVLNNMTVQGDLTVNGTTTTVNTEELFVEDRLMRLNVGTAPSFTGTTGLEMEVGSDGYVEFHWDDLEGRWEFSIDRNTTPEAQTFRPIPYLADSPPTLDLSDIGNDGFPTAGPNATGAASINTNSTNFPYSFGDYMFDDSVQSALEAIDAYFIDLQDNFADIGTTDLQLAYENGNLITTSAAEGSVVIGGTESLNVTATGGIDLDTVFDMDGSTFDVALTGAASIDSVGASNFTVDSGTLTLETTTSGDVDINSANDVLVDAANAVSIDAAAASNFTTTAGALTLDGAGGVVLDGNGSNVIPADDLTDSLGSPTNGWTDVYLANVVGDQTVALRAAGGSAVNNVTSGAHAVGTNSDNYNTFGPDMSDNSVQAALEAIDGYFVEVTSLIEASANDQTLQDIFDNSCPDPVIDVNCGTLTFTGGPVIFDNSELLVNTTANFTEEVNITGDGPFVVNVDNVNISGDDVNISGSNSLTLYGENGIVLDAYGNDVVPASSCTDSLGDPTAGWLDIYLCNAGTPIALSAEGDPAAPNGSSGSTLVGTDSDNFVTFGPTMVGDNVQSALEAIDGYLQDLSLENLDTTFRKCVGVDLFGGLSNGRVRNRDVSGTPALEFRRNNVSRVQWTIPVPSDWDGVSDIEVEAIWSPENANAGDVAWRLEYKSLALTELASAAITTVDFTQATAGATDELQSTGANLVIPAADVALTDDVIVFNLVRRGNAGADTYNRDARVHLVKYCYTAENIVS